MKMFTPSTEPKKAQTYLLDGNILIALHLSSHAHFAQATAWVKARNGAILAVCSVTEGTLLRFLMRPRAEEPRVAAAAYAWNVLRRFRKRSNVRFLAADFSYLKVAYGSLTGHRDVTDAWLAAVARKHGCRLATFDLGLVERHPDVAEIIPTSLPS
jgi:toxin-antitoxin system PIN domain toxin